MDTQRKCVRLCALAIFLVSQSVFAQPPEEEEPERIPDTVVVGQPDPFPATNLTEDTLISPNRSATPARSNASSVTVISGEQIEQTQKVTVLEVLRQTPGVNVVQSGGAGRITSVFIRGANSEHTKILLDGIPLNDPGNPTRAFDFSTLTTDNIERIEVLRGPQSMVYGSDALGGVIYIVTKRGEGPPQATGRLMGGSFGTRREAVTVSGGDDLLYYSVSGSYFDNDGISVVDQRFGGTELDSYQNATFSGRFGWTPSDLLNIDYVFRYIDADTEVDDFLADNLIRDNRLNQFFNRVQLQSFSLDGAIEQKVGFTVSDYRILDPLGFTPRIDAQTRLLYYQANLLVTDTNTITAGVDYLQEEAASTFQPFTRQNLTGVFLEDQFSLWDRSFSTIGVRWDEHSTAGSAETYRFTQLFRVDETGTSFHGTIGRGFRAPSISQRVGVFGGNPNLRPEFSKGWDIGIEQELFEGDFVFDVTYFRNDFQDLIVSVPPFFQFENVGLARTSGVEFSMKTWLTSDTQLNASYTATRTLDLLTGNELLRRPREKASVSVHKQMLDDRASLNMYCFYVGHRIDFDNNFARTTLDDYILVNLSGTYQLSDRWQLFSRVDNLFGENYEEAFGFGTPGISYFGGVRVSL